MVIILSYITSNHTTWHLHHHITTFWGLYVVHNGDKVTAYSTIKGVLICLMISLDFE
jgi:hypothetical protein